MGCKYSTQSISDPLPICAIDFQTQSKPKLNRAIIQLLKTWSRQNLPPQQSLKFCSQISKMTMKIQFQNQGIRPPNIEIESIVFSMPQDINSSQTNNNPSVFLIANIPRERLSDILNPENKAAKYFEHLSIVFEK